MSISWETLAYQCIIEEVFHSDEEFDNPLSRIAFICVACEFDRDQCDERNCSTSYFLGDNRNDQLSVHTYANNSQLC